MISDETKTQSLNTAKPEMDSPVVKHKKHPRHDSGGGMKWTDFLNPRSMLTPGIAGSVVMVIANTLWVEFMLPQKWTALVLSFILIIPILMRFSASMIENIIYFMFNGLIVFALAINTNFAGGKLTQFNLPEQGTPFASEVNSSLSTLAYRSDDVRIDKMNYIQLADNQSHHQNNPNKPQQQDKKKNQNETNNPKQPRDKRHFFQQWF